MTIMGFTNIYRLQRYNKTSGSECWEISSIGSSNAGELHVHFGEEIECTLIIGPEVADDQIEHLLDEIGDKIFYCSFPEINWTIYRGERMNVGIQYTGFKVCANYEKGKHGGKSNAS